MNKIIMRILPIRSGLKPLIFVLTVFISSYAQGQQPININVVPPSPNASEFAKYGNWPVSYYTGTPSISVPLYELTDRDLSVPISLSYHASGIKVDQMPTWVGLGWSLNAGGAITRTVLGRPDEETFGYNNYATDVQNYISGSLTGTALDNFQLSAAKGDIDTEPDSYNYSFGGQSGKLYFDNSGNAKTTPHSNLQFSGGPTTGYTVIDESGIKYEFLTIESSEIQGTNPANTSWYLSKITSPAGGEINFTYVDEVTDYQMSASASKKYLLYSFCPNPSGECSCVTANTTDINESTLTINGKRLSEITSSNLKVKFNGTIEKLTSIEVSQLNNPSEIIKKYQFNIGKFNDLTRDKLISVQEVSQTGTLLKPYEFTYDESYVMAPRLSAKKDHWGYFNNNTGDLIPQSTYGSTTYAGGFREPDSDRMKTYSLAEVKFPTGGKTVFEYEPHNINQIGAVNASTYLTKTRIESFNYEIPGDYTGTSAPFDVDFNQTVTIKYYLSKESLQSETGEYIGESILKKNGVQITGGVIFESDDPNLITSTLSLTPGTYTLDLISQETDFSLEAVIQYQIAIEEEQVNFEVGGIRVKSIKNYDAGSTTPILTRFFDYTDNSISTGVMNDPPNYGNHFYEHQQQAGHLFQEDVCRYFVRTSSNKASISMTKGSHVGYKKVTVREESAGSKGKEVYEYTTYADYSDYTNVFPQTETSFDYKRGLLTKSSVYNSSDQLLLETINTYNFREDLNYNSISGVKLAFRIYDDFSNSEYEYYNATYHQYSQWYYLESQKRIEYDPANPGQKVEKTTNYTYSSSHLQQTLMSTTSSEGQSLTTNLEYAEELNDTDLINANMIKQPLKATSKKDAQTVRIVETDYLKNGSIIMPVSVTDHPSGSADVTKMNYEYTSTGNLASAYKEGDLRTTYLWGYNESYPVAQIVNATLAEVEAISGIGAGFHAGAGSLTTAQEQALRSGLPNAQITTYTYKPGVGLLSVKDPNGRITKYEYDEFERLEKVIDHENKVIQQYEYNYGN